jgi:VanZ family protein
MFFLRMGLPRRSHLIEYSVLATFVHKALIERLNQGKYIVQPALHVLLIAFLIGVLDECIQIFLPNRVFDLYDILFNGIAVAIAIGSTLVLSWLRKRMKGT